MSEQGTLPVVDEAEIVVVGSGPGGAACAALLAERGHDVLLVDKELHPRDKPCGDGITRSTVGFLHRLGLDDVVEKSQPIDGVRVVMDHRSYEYKAYEAERDKPAQARCVTRRILDQAITDAAVERGARFLHARVTDRAKVDGSAAVEAVVDGQTALLKARTVVAADGATSRLRRVCGYTRREDHMQAYAVRAYYRTERELDPVYDIYMPVEYQGRASIGYGWVFPIDAHTANIGIGYWRGAGLTAPTKIREVLEEFIDQLSLRARARFGEIEQLSKPFGSPLGVQFDRGRCEHEGILFLGDAARTTDPLSGEGIAYAVHGAEVIADLVHERSRGRGAGLGDVGTVLGRRFPRLGQDVSFPSRLAERRLNSFNRHVTSNGGNPFLGTVRRTVIAPEDDPDLTATPAGRLAAGNERLLAQLERVNELALDEVYTGFPFAGELLHRELRSGNGPVVAMLALLAGGDDADPDRLVHGAASLELVRVAIATIQQMVDRPRGRQAQLNNALCILIADFALSRAVRQAAKAAPWLVQELCATLKQAYAVQLAAKHEMFELGDDPEEHARAQHHKIPALFAIAARFGARMAARPPEVVETLGKFGNELGAACQVSEDIVELVDGDFQSGRSPGTAVRNGNYPLPVLHAYVEDRELRRMLMRGVEKDDLPEVLERTVESGGMERAVGTVVRSAERSRAILGELNGHAAPLLAELPALMVTRARESAERAGLGDAAAAEPARVPVGA